MERYVDDKGLREVTACPEKTKLEEPSIKICHLGHKNMLERSGGVEVVVYELATRMAAMGYGVTSYNRSGHHVSGAEFDSPRVDVFKRVRMKYVPTIDRCGLAAITSSASGALCAALGKYDIVHFHAEGPAFMCWLPKILGKRVIVTIHGLDWQRKKWGRLASFYIMQGEKMAVKHADEIIVLSKNVQEYFQTVYKRKTSYIPNGVHKFQKRNADLIEKKLGLRENEYFLFLGRLVPEKGVQYLIKAFPKVQTNKKLVIAGGSSDTDGFVGELKAAAQGDDRILFTGFVEGRLLEELYSCAYAYVLPSDLEGMPLSLLEAMSYGNCCVTSDIPECVEVIEDNAVTFRKGDSDDLALCLQRLCDNECMVNEYKAKVSDFVCKNHDWKEVVNKTIALYHSKGDKTGRHVRNFFRGTKYESADN